MFGYIKPLACELKVREFELYKSFYCGLCKTMGKKISPFSRLALSYDMVFLALVRTALTGETPEAAHFRCRLKPFKKRGYIKPNNALLYVSCVSAILAYYKFIDDINDAHNKFKKFFLRIFFPPRLFLSHIRKTARRYYPGLEAQIKPPLEKLAGHEKTGCKSIDQAASCFAELMQIIASFGLDDPNQAQTAGIIGKNLGRWLYIIDALDDFDKDLRRKEYNPLIKYYSDKKNLAADIPAIKDSLILNLIEMGDAFAKFVDIDSCAAPVILNIINLGLCDCQEKIIKNI